MPLLLSLYHMGGIFGAPLVWAGLKCRQYRQKEHPERFTERFGYASMPRPAGALIWLHGASVGESFSLLPLIGKLQMRVPHATILVTTGTLTSAKLMIERLPQGVIHQFIPVDTPAAVNRFLNHWRPDLCCFVETELWPVLTRKIAARRIPLCLLSARMSDRSARRWKKSPQSIRAILSCFDLILTQTEKGKQVFKDLGASPERVFLGGKLKDAALALKASKTELQIQKQVLKQRPRWLAASTHKGEEAIALWTHLELRKDFPKLLTMIAIRHPERREEVVELAHQQGLQLSMRSQNPVPDAQTDIYLIDTLGEMGLWYQLSPIVFMGGSLVPVGGHNPLEPAWLDCAILHGPHVESCAEIYHALNMKEAALEVATGELLPSSLKMFMTEEGFPNSRAEKLARAAFEEVQSCEDPLAPVMEALDPFLSGMDMPYESS